MCEIRKLYTGLVNPLMSTPPQTREAETLTVSVCSNEQKIKSYQIIYSADAFSRFGKLRFG